MFLPFFMCSHQTYGLQKMHYSTKNKAAFSRVILLIKKNVYSRVVWRFIPKKIKKNTSKPKNACFYTWILRFMCLILGRVSFYVCYFRIKVLSANLQHEALNKLKHYHCRIFKMTYDASSLLCLWCYVNAIFCDALIML